MSISEVSSQIKELCDSVSKQFEGQTKMIWYSSNLLAFTAIFFVIVSRDLFASHSQFFFFVFVHVTSQSQTGEWNRAVHVNTQMTPMIEKYDWEVVPCYGDLNIKPLACRCLIKESADDWPILFLWSWSTEYFKKLNLVTVGSKIVSCTS